MVRRTLAFAALAAALAAAAGAFVANTASNVVPGSRLGQIVQPITVNDLKPPACAGITLTSLVTGSGIFAGTVGADLILGGAGVDTITGNNGDDCILGGGGLDQLSDNGGNDVCIAGRGGATYASCESQL